MKQEQEVRILSEEEFAAEAKALYEKNCKESDEQRAKNARAAHLENIERMKALFARELGVDISMFEEPAFGKDGRTFEYAGLLFKHEGWGRFYASQICPNCKEPKIFRDIYDMACVGNAYLEKPYHDCPATKKEKPQPPKTEPTITRQDKIIHQIDELIDLMGICRGHEE